MGYGVGVAFGEQPLGVDLLGDGDEGGAWCGRWVDAEAVKEHDRQDHAADRLGELKAGLVVLRSGVEFPLKEAPCQGVQLFPAAARPAQQLACCLEKGQVIWFGLGGQRVVDAKSMYKSSVLRGPQT